MIRLFSIFSLSAIDLNITLVETNIDTCWYTNSSGQNLTIASCANQTLNLTDGSHNITFYANDTFGNLVSDKKTFNVTAAAPQITFINSVTNNTNITNPFLYINITTSEIVLNATIESDSVNYTMNGSSLNWYYNITNLNDGVHYYKIFSK